MVNLCKIEYQVCKIDFFFALESRLILNMSDMNNTSTDDLRKARRIAAAADSLTMIQNLLAEMRQETAMIDDYRVKVVNYYMRAIEAAQTAPVTPDPPEDNYPGTSTLISTIRVPPAPVPETTEVKKRPGHVGKLSEAAVREIRSSKETPKNLAAFFSISIPMISAIRSGKAYKHVK